MKVKRMPEWVRRKHSYAALRGLKTALRDGGVATVCEEARCPNKAECFTKPTATFMILGRRCTRGCGFCSVERAEGGLLGPPNPEEPLKVAHAARRMGLRFVVITSVTRDDLPDGGAAHFAATIRAVKDEIKGTKVEVLTPDFMGDDRALLTVVEAGPDVFNHNVETVPSLYPRVRPQADYRRSLGVLERARAFSPDTVTKSGLMLGLGEGMDEVRSVIKDLRNAGCDLVTIGQYMRPTRNNLPVAEYVSPETFEMLGEEALSMGFRFAASSPLVRSSMNAEEMYGPGVEGCRV